MLFLFDWNIFQLYVCLFYSLMFSNKNICRKLVVGPGLCAAGCGSGHHQPAAIHGGSDHGLGHGQVNPAALLRCLFEKTWIYKV